MNESGVWRRGNEGVMMSFKSAMPSLYCCYRSQKRIKKRIKLGHSELIGFQSEWSMARVCR